MAGRASHALRQIAFVLSPNLAQVALQPLPDRQGEHREPVLLSLAPPQDDLVPVEVEVLHAQLKAVLDSEPRAVEKHDDDPHRARQVFHDSLDFVAAEHDRHANRHTRAGHLLDRAQRKPKHGPILRVAGS